MQLRGGGVLQPQGAQASCERQRQLSADTAALRERVGTLAASLEEQQQLALAAPQESASEQRLALVELPKLQQRIVAMDERFQEMVDTTEDLREGIEELQAHERLNRLEQRLKNVEDADEDRWSTSWGQNT